MTATPVIGLVIDAIHMIVSGCTGLPEARSALPVASRCSTLSFETTSVTTPATSLLATHSSATFETAGIFGASADRAEVARKQMIDAIARMPRRWLVRMRVSLPHAVAAGNHLPRLGHAGTIGDGMRQRFCGFVHTLVILAAAHLTGCGNPRSSQPAAADAPPVAEIRPVVDE